MNPFTKRPYNELINTTAKFPASDPLIIEELRSLYKKNDVLIIKAATGSGKSVVIASEIMKIENVDKNGIVLPVKKVVITEPRSLNTHTADYLNSIYDSKIFGRAYRGEMHITPETRMDFVTDGYLLNFFLKDDIKYEVVIIDEVHTRNINIDLLLAFTHKYLGNKIKKIILMSATIDPKYYGDYYEKFKVGILEIPGTNYPIKDVYLNKEDNYVKQSVKIINSLKPLDGNILIFLASSTELKKACRMIKENCYELHKGAPEQIKQSIITKSGEKVIFSTNIAESGITMPNLKYVIDSGRSYKKIFNSSENMYELNINFVSKSEIQQRRGRVGRTGNGICFYLYSESDYEKFVDYQLPEIISEEISGLLLKLIINNNFEIIHNMPDIPKHINFGLDILKNLSLINQELKTTELGINVYNTGLDPQFAAAYLESKKLGVNRSICMILSILEVEPEISKWFTDEKAIFNSNRDGEIFVLKEILEKFMYNSDPMKWCEKNKYNYNKLLSAKRQFFKMQHVSDTADIVMVKKVLERAFPLNIAVKHDNKYIINRPVKYVMVEKSKYLKTLSKKILYLDIIKIEGKVVLGSIVNLNEENK